MRPTGRPSDPTPQASRKATRLNRHSDRPMGKIQEVHDQSNSDYEAKSIQSDPDDIFQPLERGENKAVRRQSSKALSEVQCSSQQIPKGTSKYKKKENQGNILVDEARIKNIFRQVCDPDGCVTVDSLGHTLQRFHIDFDLRDLSEMIALFWMLKEEPVPQQQEGRIEEDEGGQFNLSLKLNFKQFQELFRMIRGKK